MGRARVSIAALAVCALAVAPAHAADSGAPLLAAYQVKDISTLRMGLERDYCIGTCPYYTVEIAGDGTATYDGKDCVAVAGVQTVHVDDAKVKKLLAMFAAVDFWSLEDKYRGGEPDGPGYFITLSFDGRTKRVLDYLGTTAGMPKAVEAIEDEIDRAAGTNQWLVGPGSWKCQGRTVSGSPPHSVP